MEKSKQEIRQALKEALDLANGQITETCVTPIESRFWSGYVKVLDHWILAFDLPDDQHKESEFAQAAYSWGGWKIQSDILARNWGMLIDSKDQEYIDHRRSKIIQGHEMIGAALDNAMAFCSNQ